MSIRNILELKIFVQEVLAGFSLISLANLASVF